MVDGVEREREWERQVWRGGREGVSVGRCMEGGVGEGVKRKEGVCNEGWRSNWEY